MGDYIRRAPKKLSIQKEMALVSGEIMTRILLYSDEPILAKGLESVLRQIDGFDLLPLSNTVVGLMQQLESGQPDVVLVDLTPEVTFGVLSEMKHWMGRMKVVLW